MTPKPALLASIVLALVLPAVATPAMAAVVYVPAECQQVPPDVPEECPGITVGDPLAAPDDECLEPFTNFVYRCVDPGTYIGVGVPTAYISAWAESAISDADCFAQTRVTHDQWCAEFRIAMVARYVWGSSIAVEAKLVDSCDPLHPIFQYEDTYVGTAVWRSNMTGPSQCGHPFGFVTATIEAKDAATGQRLAWMESSAVYGPEGVHWIGLGGPCYGYGPAQCKIYYEEGADDDDDFPQI